MLNLLNRTGSTAIPGYLVKISPSKKGAFEYSGIGDVPIGVVSADGEILTSGIIEMFTDTYVPADGPVRGIVASDKSRKGFVAPVGDETAYTLVGRALDGGRGRIKVLVNIFTVVASSGGAGGVAAGGTIGQVYTKNSSVDFDAGWAAGGVTGVTGSNGIASSGGTTPNITFDGTSLPVASTTLLASAGIVAVAGSEEERYVVEDIPLSIFDNNLGWTTNTGTVIGVQGSGAITSSGGTNPTIGFDAELLPIQGTALLAADYMLVWDTDATTTGRKLVSTIPLGEFNNNEGWDTGTVESVLGGYGIVSDSDTVNPSLSFDGSELDIDDGTAFAGTSYFMFVAGAVSELRRTTLVDISTFVNDTGFTTNTGTVTNVSATAPLASSGGTTPNITFDASSIPIKGGAVLEDDFLVTIDGVSGAMERKAIEFIPLSEFNNDEGWEANHWTQDGTDLYYTAGEVGIGTVSPSFPFHVYYSGNLTALLESTGDTNIRFRSSAADKFIAGYDANPEGFRIYDYQGTAGTRFFVQSSTGNVGIGTSSPEALFHVKAVDTVTGIIKVEGGKEVVTAIGEINSQLDFGSNDDSCQDPNQIGGRIASITEATNGANIGMAFYTYDQTYTTAGLTEKMRIDNEGNVGIGDTTPSYKLDVNGTIRATSTIYAMNNGIRAYVDNGGVSYWGGNGTGGNIEMYGGSHATLANRIYYDADLHTFRVQDGSPTIMTLADGAADVTGNITASGEITAFA